MTTLNDIITQAPFIEFPASDEPKCDCGAPKGTRHSSACPRRMYNDALHRAQKAIKEPLTTKFILHHGLPVAVDINRKGIIGGLGQFHGLETEVFGSENEAWEWRAAQIRARPVTWNSESETNRGKIGGWGIIEGSDKSGQAQYKLSRGEEIFIVTYCGCGDDQSGATNLWECSCGDKAVCDHVVAVKNWITEFYG